MGDIGRERRRIVVRPLTEPVLAHGTSLTHRAAGMADTPWSGLGWLWSWPGCGRLAPTTDPGPDQLG